MLCTVYYISRNGRFFERSDQKYVLTNETGTYIVYSLQFKDRVTFHLYQLQCDFHNIQNEKTKQKKQKNKKHTDECKIKIHGFSFYYA